MSSNTNSNRLIPSRRQLSTYTCRPITVDVKSCALCKLAGQLWDNVPISRQVSLRLKMEELDTSYGSLSELSPTTLMSRSMPYASSQSSSASDVHAKVKHAEIYVSCSCIMASCRACMVIRHPIILSDPNRLSYCYEGLTYYSLFVLHWPEPSPLLTNSITSSYSTRMGRF